MGHFCPSYPSDTGTWCIGGFHTVPFSTAYRVPVGYYSRFSSPYLNYDGGIVLSPVPYLRKGNYTPPSSEYMGTSFRLYRYCRHPSRWQQYSRGTCWIDYHIFTTPLWTNQWNYFGFPIASERRLHFLQCYGSRTGFFSMIGTTSGNQPSIWIHIQVGILIWIWIRNKFLFPA